MKVRLFTILAAVCIFGNCSILPAATPGKNIRIQQHTKEALMETFIIAYAMENVDMLWELLPPQMRKKMSMQGTAAAKEGFWQSAKSSTTPETMKALKQLLKDATARKLAAAEMSKQYGKNIVKVNGKYYIDLLGIAAAEATSQQTAALKKPDAIDHSTPERLIETFYLAACFKDADLLFEALSPAMRAKATSGIGIKEAKKSVLEGFTAVWTPQMFEQFKMILSGNSKHQFIATITTSFQDKLVFVNGKWYLDFTKKSK